MVIDNIYVIGFEGLNRCGKKTQADLLEDYLKGQGVAVTSLRGEGTRKGLGTDPADPHSPWWQERLSYFFSQSTSIEEKIYKANLISYRINFEAKQRLAEFSSQMETDGTRGFMLLDRTYISRLFVMRQFDPEITFEDALQITNPEDSRIISALIPDLNFILEVSKENLIKRCNGDDDPKKRNFRKDIINNYYDLFCRVYQEAIQTLDYDICIIDGDADQLKVHEQIKSKVLAGLTLGGRMSDAIKMD